MEQLVNTLTELKLLGCSGIKISFEDEGALLNEIMTMRYLTAYVGLNLFIKIGGCEAKRDIQDCIDINCDAIVSPMIESKFSLSKFIHSSKNYTGKRGINIETISGYKDIENIKELFTHLDFVTFGRVDYVTSLNKDRSYVNSDHIIDDVKRVFSYAKEAHIECCLGGAITTESFKFISSLSNLGLLDKFETRYVIFDINKIDLNNFDTLIYLSNQLELEWMKYVQNRYTTQAMKDSKRIDMIENRIRLNKIKE